MNNAINRGYILGIICLVGGLLVGYAAGCAVGMAININDVNTNGAPPPSATPGYHRPLEVGDCVVLFKHSSARVEFQARMAADVGLYGLFDLVDWPVVEAAGGPQAWQKKNIFKTGENDED